MSIRMNPWTFWLGFSHAFSRPSLSSLAVTTILVARASSRQHCQLLIRVLIADTFALHITMRRAKARLQPCLQDLCDRFHHSLQPCMHSILSQVSQAVCFVRWKPAADESSGRTCH